MDRQIFNCMKVRIKPEQKSQSTNDQAPHQEGAAVCSAEKGCLEEPGPAIPGWLRLRHRIGPTPELVCSSESRPLTGAARSLTWRADERARRLSVFG